MAGVAFQKVTKTYPDGTKAVDGLDLAIADGEFMVLVGPSGCGKTTALRMVAGLEEISAGAIRIGEQVVNDLDCGERDVAMVFQNYALYPHMSVYENLNFPLKLAGLSRAERQERIARTARMLGIEAHLARKPARLSGGQRQRVAMGRALVRQPQVFLMDEPLSNLDAKLRVQMRAEIAALQRSLGITAIYVTHDQVEALTMGDRIAIMRGGLLQQVAEPAVIYDAPANLFVAAFIGAPPMNLLDAEIVAEAGSLFLQIGPVRLKLAPEEAPPARQDSRVVVGFRPEKLRPSVGAPGERLLTGRVRFRESIGSDLFVTLALDGVPPLSATAAELAHVVEDRAEAEGLQAEKCGTIVARLLPDTPHRLADAMALEVPPGALQLFDAGSGQALGRRVKGVVGRSSPPPGKRETDPINREQRS